MRGVEERVARPPDGRERLADGRTSRLARHREPLTALAETAIPPGTVFPGASEQTVRTIESALGRGPGFLASGYGALVRALDAVALARHGRRFARLDPARRLEVPQVTIMALATRAADLLGRALGA